MLRVLVNAGLLTGLQTGMSRYVRCLYREMARQPDAEVSYLTIQGRSGTMPSGAEPRQWCRQTERFWRLPDALIVAMTAVQRLRYEHCLRRQAQYGVDVYHETDFFAPRGCPVPVVFTLHDLSLLDHPDKHPRERVWYSRLFFRRRLRYADRIITVSHFVRGEVMRRLGVDPGRVRVVHEAAAPIFGPRPQRRVETVLRALGLPDEYVLFVGTQEPRKNLRLLVEAMACLERPVALVLAGWSGWGSRDWLRRLEALGLGHRVFLTGYVDEETLVCLYGGARVMVYPSLYEGFGLPVLEAMACGCPVICSRVASLPEVAGDAVLYIDPRQVETLVEALNAVLTRPALREQLVAAGKDRSRLFSWRKCARQTLQVLREAKHRV